MRTLVISDIHASLEGMDACLASAQGKYDAVFNLGDVVGYGASPNEVVAKSIALGGLLVRGNHDKACAGLSDLDDFNHIAARDAYEPLAAPKERITFFGHTHIQAGFSLGTNDDGTPEITILRPFYDTKDQLETFELPLLDNLKYLINPGSAGQPRDGDWRVAFAIYDDEAKLVTFYRIPYDIKGAQEKIYKANLPDRLATRLDSGH